MHAVGYPGVQNALVGEHPVLQFDKLFKVVIVREFENLGCTFDDVCLVDVAVVARKHVEDGKLFLQLALVRLFLLVSFQLMLKVPGNDFVGVLEACDDVSGVFGQHVLELVVVHLIVFEHAVVSGVFVFALKLAFDSLELDRFVHRVAVGRMYALKDVLLLHGVVVVNKVGIFVHARRDVAVELKDFDHPRFHVDEVNVGVGVRKRAEDGQQLFEFLVLLGTLRGGGSSRRGEGGGLLLWAGGVGGALL